MTFSLSSYTLRVKKNSTDEYVTLDNFDGTKDILDELNSFFNSLQSNSSRDDNEQKMMMVPSFNIASRTLNGIIETGDYGFESKLVDVDTDSVSYERKKNEAEMLPFYFLIKVPSTKDEGIILLQRFKQFGVRKIFLDHFSKFFASNNVNYTVEINPVFPEKLIEQYLDNGRVTKIRFIRYKMPTDIADRYNTEDHIEEEGTTELVVSTKRNTSIPLVGQIKRFLDGEIQIDRLIEIQNYDYEDVKIEVNINNKPKVIPLGNLNKIRPYYDIDHELTVGDNGHPDFDSIDRISRNLMQDLFEVMNRGT